MTRTALARNSKTKNLKIFRADDYRTQTEMAQDLRGERLQGSENLERKQER